MSRSQLTAFCLSLPMVFGLLGCGQSNPGGTWDAAAVRYEAAPPREIIGGTDGGEGVGGSDPGSMMPRSFGKLCKMATDPWCCYDNYNVIGIPLCAWKALVPGNSVVIDSAFAANQKVPLDNPLTLTSVTPERYTSADECGQMPVGFVLSGKDLMEEPLRSNLYYYQIKKNGTWAPAGGGESYELVIAKNTADEPPGDAGTGSLPPPQAKLSGESCAPSSEVTANVVLFDFLRYRTTDGKEWELSFSRPPSDSTLAYYVRIERTY
jgi:hypothetical protein